MYSLIETGLVQNDSCVFEEHKIHFYKPTEPIIHQQEWIIDESVATINPLTTGQWLKSHITHFLF